MNDQLDKGLTVKEAIELLHRMPADAHLFVPCAGCDCASRINVVELVDGEVELRFK